MSKPPCPTVTKAYQIIQQKLRFNSNKIKEWYFFILKISQSLLLFIIKTHVNGNFPTKHQKQSNINTNLQVKLMKL